MRKGVRLFIFLFIFFVRSEGCILTVTDGVGHGRVVVVTIVAMMIAMQPPMTDCALWWGGGIAVYLKLV